MVRSIGLGSIAVVVSCLLNSSVLAQVTLELKFPEETRFTIHSEAKTKQILTLSGRDLETKSTTFLVTTKSVGKRASDGSLPVVDKITVMQTDVSLSGGNRIEFDSANPDKKAENPMLEPLVERLRVTFKTPVTTILDENNRITAIKLPEGLADSVDDSNKSLFDPRKRKTTAEQARSYLPDGRVKPGDSWERSIDLDLGGGQAMAFRVTYFYAGTVEQDGRIFDKIRGKATSVNYSVGDNSAGLKLVKSDLKVMESDETILFDRKRGAMQLKTARLTIKGPLTLVVGGQELDGKIDLAIEEKTTLQK
jgi:hypothetical protein